MNIRVDPPIPTSAVIGIAEGAAQKSPCAKSKRGVAIYSRGVNDQVLVHASGFNGPPAGFSCDDTAQCREACPKKCVHAEMRAVRELATRLPEMTRPRFLGDAPSGPFLVHVKIGDRGQVIGGGPPSCWQCSREILDSNFVRGVWLYEAQSTPVHLLSYPPQSAVATTSAWVFYTAEEFHRATLKNCGLPE